MKWVSILVSDIAVDLLQESYGGPDGYGLTMGNYYFKVHELDLENPTEGLPK